MFVFKFESPALIHTIAISPNILTLYTSKENPPELYGTLEALKLEIVSPKSIPYDLLHHPLIKNDEPHLHFKIKSSQLIGVVRKLFDQLCELQKDSFQRRNHFNLFSTNYKKTQLKNAPDTLFSKQENIQNSYDMNITYLPENELGRFYSEYEQYFNDKLNLKFAEINQEIIQIIIKNRGAHEFLDTSTQLELVAFNTLLAQLRNNLLVMTYPKGYPSIPFETSRILSIIKELINNPQIKYQPILIGYLSLLNQGKSIPDPLQKEIQQKIESIQKNSEWNEAIKNFLLIYGGYLMLNYLSPEPTFLKFLLPVFALIPILNPITKHHVIPLLSAWGGFFNTEEKSIETESSDITTQIQDWGSL